MCGILFVLNPEDNSFNKRLKTLIPRGPDEYSIIAGDNYIAGHTRNCITNPMGGKQPIESGKWIVVHNGEIYNASEDSKQKQSDSYHIIDVMNEFDPIKAPSRLDGIFAYVAYNMETGEYYAARDPVGVIPLYMAKDGDTIWFSSELKALKGLDAEICMPGQIVTKNGAIKYTTPYVKDVPSGNFVSGTIERLMDNSCSKRLHLDVPWGVLLSGGLDSSIIGSIIYNQHLDTIKWNGNIHTFSIGLEGSPDLEKAREMAMQMDSVHHEYVFTIQEGLEVLRSVIYAIETYDVTTIRASVPMYILGKYIRKCGVKVVFSGEGSDELFAGYLYFKHCPNRGEMHAECVDKMERLHYHDCLRANKSMACHGVETRVPFLDKDLVHYTMNVLDPVYKMSGTHPNGDKPTKWLLREEFKDYLSEDLIKRRKEQFSDGVGTEWIDALKAHAEKTVYTFHKAAEIYPFQTPKTKEAFLYREIFTELFGKEGEKTVFYSDDTCACSTERGLTWSDTFKKDPSAKHLC